MNELSCLHGRLKTEPRFGEWKTQKSPLRNQRAFRMLILLSGRNLYRFTDSRSGLWCLRGVNWCNTPIRVSVSPYVKTYVGLVLNRLHRGEQDDVANGIAAGEQHDAAVNSDA